MAHDSTVKKVDSQFSPRGKQGQIYLVTGQSLSMRLWRESKGCTCESPGRDYETIGYMIEGAAILKLDSQVVTLGPGDSWLVPKGSPHSYEVTSDLFAVEATSPPAHIHDRDS